MSKAAGAKPAVYRNYIKSEEKVRVCSGAPAETCPRGHVSSMSQMSRTFVGKERDSSVTRGHVSATFARGHVSAGASEQTLSFKALIDDFQTPQRVVATRRVRCSRLLSLSSTSVALDVFWPVRRTPGTLLIATYKDTVAVSRKCFRPQRHRHVSFRCIFL